MAYQENRQGKLKRQTSKQAIALAMQGRWQEAVVANKSIIESFPKDVDAHNRLGKAYLELGDYSQAREVYSKAVQLDQYNTIARKNLERLSHLGDEAALVAESPIEKAEPHLFIEEIGKAGVMNLSQITSPDKLVKMMAGDKLTLKPLNSTLSVENMHGDYLGLVPTRLGKRLIKLMEGGNKYTAAVVASNEKAISIIIRETYQHPSQINQISFPGKRLDEIQPYVSDRVFRPDYEEDEELPEASVFTDEVLEEPEEVIGGVEADKEWEREA